MKALRLAMLLVAATAISTGASAQQQDAQAEPQKKIVPPTPRQQEKIFPVGTTWVAVSLGGKSFGGERPSLSVDNQFRGRGFGGCNTYSATIYPLRNQTLAVGPVALTKRKCPGGANASEIAFLTALRSAQKWDIVNGTMIIQTGRGELRLARSL